MSVYKSNIIIFFCVLASLISTSAFSDELHEVRQGETVYQLSKRYGIPVEVLLDINNIDDPSDIPTGYALQIPELNDNTTSNDNANTVTTIYHVQKGDTLFSIAHKYNIKLPELRQLNKNVSDSIKIGQSIRVPKSDINSTKIADSANTQAKKITKSPVAHSQTNNSKTTFSFKKLNSLELLESQSFGKISGNWPISGTGYMLEGKLPGVLIEGLEGQAVHSSSNGVVLYAALHTSFSNVVVVQGDDGIVYVYAGQKSLYVQQGDAISKGATIGELGVMPTLQKPLLYFSVWDKNKFLDPRRIMG